MSAPAVMIGPVLPRRGSPLIQVKGVITWIGMGGMKKNNETMYLGSSNEDMALKLSEPWQRKLIPHLRHTVQCVRSMRCILQKSST